MFIASKHSTFFGHTFSPAVCALPGAVCPTRRAHYTTAQPALRHPQNKFEALVLPLLLLSGEPELLMASRVLQRPISVYQATWTGPQYILMYGEEYGKTAKPMHLLWSGAHYDLLLPQPSSKL